MKKFTRKEKKIGRLKRRKRIRHKVVGSPQRPRLSVFRSTKNIYAQIVDDIEGKTMLSCSTVHKDIRAKIGYGGNVKAAALLGEELAKKATAKGIKKIVFDRGGYRYHGRLKALAENLRKGGLEF
jgi:large subunit ribosomal protein L18